MSAGDSFDSLFVPSSVFNRREECSMEAQDRTLLEERVESVSRQILCEIQDPSTSDDTIIRDIVTLSGDSPLVQHLVLQIIHSLSGGRESIQGRLKVMDDEAICNLQEPIQRTLEYQSALDISLREGDLPAIPSLHRQVLSQYLKGLCTVKDVEEILSLDSSNAKEILRSLKVMDLETDRLTSIEKEVLNHSNSSYELRTLCLQASEGVLNTYEVYTKSINSQYFDNPFSAQAREYAKHEYNYIPERVRDHTRALGIQVVEMMALSRRLDLDHRVIYCIAGNVGVGKSRCAKEDSEFAKGVIDGEIVGAISLDSVKYNLRKGIPKVTNQQVHAEGLLLSNKISGELKNKAIQTSLVIDERLGTRDLVDRLMSQVSESKTKIRYKDIDGSLLVSALRVLGRDVAKEPCIPSAPICDGFRRLRRDRESIINLAMSNEAFESYELYVGDAQGNQVLVAKKLGDILEIKDQELYRESLRQPTDAEIFAVENQLITDDFIANVSMIAGVKRESLEKYKGKTISEALEAHSKELPVYQ